jgi:hypothetical protein
MDTAGDPADVLADVLHEEMCNELPRCGRWGNPASGHQEYYRDKARAIIARLEPEIGIANVSLAARVILGEML